MLFRSTIESLLRNKNEVMETFVCASFAEWEVTQNERVKNKVAHVRGLLSNRQFWDSVGDVYHVMMPIMLSLRQLDTRLPIMLALRQLDTRFPNIGKVWMAWWTVQQSLKDPSRARKKYC